MLRNLLSRVVEIVTSETPETSKKSRRGKRSKPYHRSLRLESLENRELLSVQLGDFTAIKGLYNDLGLTEFANYNCIEVNGTTSNGTDEFAFSLAGLKAAIARASETPEDDIIVVRTNSTNQKTLTYDKAADEISINIKASDFGSVTIVTLGSDNSYGSLTLDAAQKSRVLSVAQHNTVALAGLTITGGNGYNGGGISNAGALTVTYSTINNNTTGGVGGGIHNSGGAFKITHTTISGNSAVGDGGGVYSSGGSGSTLAHCTIIGNTGRDGGGVFSYGWGDTIGLNYCTVAGNTAKGDSGGVYFNGAALGDPGSLIQNSIIAMNYSKHGEANFTGAFNSKSAAYNSFVDYNPWFVNGPVFDGNGKLLNADTLDVRLSEYTPTAAKDKGSKEYSGPFDKPLPHDYSVVTTLNDVFDLDKNNADGEISLREAIWAARGYTEITFAVSGTIALNSTLGQLFVDKAIKIDGDNRITLDGQNLTRVIAHSSALKELKDDANILWTEFVGLTITRGKTDLIPATGGVRYNGGGILSTQGDLKLTNCIVSANTGGQGGGIHKRGGALTVTNSSVSDNYSWHGGGIYMGSGAGDALNLSNSVISGNVANDGNGGGILGGGGAVTITSCSIVNNIASRIYSDGSGGGIFVGYGYATITNSTISGNRSGSGGGGIWAGISGTLTNCTIVYNTAGGWGGGIYGGYDWKINNSIIALNKSGDTNREENADIFHIIEDNNNLISYNATPLTNDTLKLGELMLVNGQYVHPLLTGSSAINTGDDNFITGFALDQAKRTRIVGSAVDIGAYEYNISDKPTLSAPTQNALSVKNASTLTVAWTAVPNATKYTLEYKLASGSTWSTKENITWNANGYDLTGLTVNSAYNVRIIAIGDSSEFSNSLASEVKTETPVKEKIAAPTVLESTKTVKTLTFTWAEITDAVGYEIEIKTSSGAYTPVTATPTKTGDTYSVTITGLLANTSYTVRVKAIAAASNPEFKDSDWSAEVPAKTDDVLAAPSIINTTAATYATSNTSIQVTWNPAVVGANGYTIQYSTDKDFTAGVKTMTGHVVGGSETSITLTGLTKNTTYYLRVMTTAENTEYNSVWSTEEVKVTTLNKVLATPAIKTIVPAATAITLTWVPKADAKSYYIQWSVDGINWSSKADGQIWQDVQNNNVGDQTCEVKPLNPNTKYFFRIQAVGIAKTNGGTPSATDSAWSAVKNIATKIGVVAAPTEPKLSQFTETGKQGLKLTWNAPSTGVTGYTIEIFTNDKYTAGKITQLVDASTLTPSGGKVSVMLASLKAGTTYWVRIKATGTGTTSGFVGDKDNPIFETAPNAIQLQPPILNAVTKYDASKPDATKMTISWSSVANAKYEWTIYDASGKAIDGKKDIPTNNTSVTVTGLTANTAYSFTVKSISKESTPTKYLNSDESTKTACHTGLKAPSLTKVSSTGTMPAGAKSAEVKVEWKAPYAISEAELAKYVKGYIIEYSTDAKFAAAATKQTVSLTSLKPDSKGVYSYTLGMVGTDEVLSPATKYYIRIKAIGVVTTPDGKGDSPYTAAKNLTTQKQQLVAPVIVNKTEVNDKKEMTVTWTWTPDLSNNTSNGFKVFYSYEDSKTGKAVTKSVTVKFGAAYEVKLTKLQADVSYQVWVVALGKGNSVDSIDISAPKGFTLSSKNAGEITATWTIASGVTYEVQYRTAAVGTTTPAGNWSTPVIATSPYTIPVVLTSTTLYDVHVRTVLTVNGVITKGDWVLKSLKAK